MEKQWYVNLSPSNDWSLTTTKSLCRGEEFVQGISSLLSGTKSRDVVKVGWRGGKARKTSYGLELGFEKMNWKEYLPPRVQVWVGRVDQNVIKRRVVVLGLIWSGKMLMLKKFGLTRRAYLYSTGAFVWALASHPGKFFLHGIHRRHIPQKIFRRRQSRSHCLQISDNPAAVQS